MKNHRKGRDYTLPVALFLILVLTALGSRSPNSFQGSYSTQVESYGVPPIADIGPTDNGSTVLVVVNSIPHPMNFRILVKGGTERKISLAACATCKIYSSPSEIPPDIYDRGTKTSFTVSPGRNFADWHYPGANISHIQAYWDLKPGRKYSVSAVMDLTSKRSDWNSTK
jgi:hypothetical protein